MKPRHKTRSPDRGVVFEYIYNNMNYNKSSYHKHKLSYSPALTPKFYNFDEASLLTITIG